MKYIDADKIRTEIKRLKAENNCGTDEFIAAKDIAYDKVFDFLENLEEPVTDFHDLTEAAEKYGSEYPAYNNDQFIAESAFKAGAEWQKRKQPKVKGYGVMRKMEDPHPDDWYMDERGKEHCWGYKFNEPCPWPAEVYIMEAKEGAER